MGRGRVCDRRHGADRDDRTQRHEHRKNGIAETRVTLAGRNVVEMAHGATPYYKRGTKSCANDYRHLYASELPLRPSRWTPQLVPLSHPPPSFPFALPLDAPGHPHQEAPQVSVTSWTSLDSRVQPIDETAKSKTHAATPRGRLERGS